MQLLCKKRLYLEIIVFEYDKNNFRKFKLLLKSYNTINELDLGRFNNDNSFFITTKMNKDRLLPSLIIFIIFYLF